MALGLFKGVALRRCGSWSLNVTGVLMTASHKPLQQFHSNDARRRAIRWTSLPDLRTQNDDRIHAVVVGGCLRASSSDAVHAQSPMVVKISEGSVRGSLVDGVASWKGNPFAAPPVGRLRWRAPQPATPWTGVRDALDYQHDCMQLPFPSDAAPLGTTPSEDCLYLNVWKPAQTTGRLPVLVWIYGGGWVNGGASPATYSGANLAREGILVARFNYRIGRFGVFAHPQLTRESADNGLRINYGTLDQIAALKWLQKNVAAFGGDPDNVTVMGESAGGVSLHVLNTSTSDRSVSQGHRHVRWERGRSRHGHARGCRSCWPELHPPPWHRDDDTQAL